MYCVRLTPSQVVHGLLIYFMFQMFPSWFNKKKKKLSRIEVRFLLAFGILLLMFALLLKYLVVSLEGIIFFSNVHELSY